MQFKNINGECSLKVTEVGNKLEKKLYAGGEIIAIC